jgi:hypothetical protein
MSTGADCQIIERKPGEWTLRLQCYPYGCNEEYQTFGPFKSEDAAIEYLDDNFANPGGWTTTYYEVKK